MTDIVERLRIWDDPGETICAEAADEIERLRKELRNALCPGGGYTGQPSNENPTVDACLKAGVCGCSHGAALEATQ